MVVFLCNKHLIYHIEIKCYNKKHAKNEYLISTYKS